jgi:3-deoxy-manno-octulosonate cytidylyltransferase (CMP-KDO synthetase)
MNIVGIIPARYASTRFPGKPLVDIDGDTMVVRVVKQAKKCSLLSRVVVATDDIRIFDHVQSFGYEVVMTSPRHTSGTERCLEAFTLLNTPADAVINIQGDEPFVHPLQLEALAKRIAQPDVEIATLAKKIEAADVLFDPNKVKVIFNPEGKAIYFSRWAIPFQKGRDQKEWLAHHTYYKHLGLYAYKVSALQSICYLPPSTLEEMESLEQLRWLEAGKAIFVDETNLETPAIDTPDDLANLLRSMSS